MKLRRSQRYVVNAMFDRLPRQRRNGKLQGRVQFAQAGNGSAISTHHYLRNRGTAPFAHLNVNGNITTLLSKVPRRHLQQTNLTSTGRAARRVILRFRYDVKVVRAIRQLVTRRRQ